MDENHRFRTNSDTLVLYRFLYLQDILVNMVMMVAVMMVMVVMMMLG